MVREEKESLGEKQTNAGFIVKKKSKTFVYGIDTTTKSRNLMMTMLPEIIDTEYDKIISPKVYSNISTLEKKKNGKIEHASNAHDDNLFSYLIFRYALHFGKCLRDKFHIMPIPTKTNVKTVSNYSDYKRIEAVIEQSNALDNRQSLLDNPAYQNILDYQKKINNDPRNQPLEEDKTPLQNKSEAFLRILSLNDDNDGDDGSGNF